jgi:phospholipid/cholesterol/gamma-HCH transport system ATP-binding protein
MNGIELHNVTYRVGEVTIIDNFSEFIPEGSIYCLIGSSGSGKTSLIKIINGLVMSIEGAVLVNGDNIYTLKPQPMLDYHRQCGLVFQNSGLISNMTVFENLSLPFEYHSDLKKQNIFDKIIPYFEEFSLSTTILSMRPAFLSSGEKTIVCIIRAMMKDPEFCFWDEPHLDHIHQQKIKNIIIDKKRMGKTNLLVTSNTTLAMQIADKIGILHKGQLIGSGTPSEIKKNKNQTIQQLIEE